MNKIFLRTDKGEYQPGETVCGAVYIDIRTPTEAHGVQLSFNGKETVYIECNVCGNKTPMQASHDYVDYCKADLFMQKDPFALGSYCFPFRLQIPCVIPGSFTASSGNSANVWSALVAYRLCASIVGSDSMEVEQEIVIRAITPESLRNNHITQAYTAMVSTGGFFHRSVYVTIKPHANFIKSGECARLKMVLTNRLGSRSGTFSIKLMRCLTVTIPCKPKPSLDASGDHLEDQSPSQPDSEVIQDVEGGPVVIWQMTGDLSQQSSHSLSRGGVLDNIMIPLKSADGKNVIPSVHGKFVQCDYSLEVSFHINERKVQTVSCPIVGVLPVENAQWLSWKTQPWMHTAHVKLSSTPGAITPPEQLLDA